MVCLFGTGRNVLPSPMVARKSFTSNLCINLPLLLEKPKCFQDGAILQKREAIQFWTLRNLFGHWGVVGGGRAVLWLDPGMKERGDVRTAETLRCSPDAVLSHKHSDQPCG